MHESLARQDDSTNLHGRLPEEGLSRPVLRGAPLAVIQSEQEHAADTNGQGLVEIDNSVGPESRCLAYEQLLHLGGGKGRAALGARTAQTARVALLSQGRVEREDRD